MNKQKTFQAFVKEQMAKHNIDLKRLGFKLSGKMFNTQLYNIIEQGRVPTSRERNDILIALGRHGYACENYWKVKKGSMYLDRNVYQRQPKMIKVTGDIKKDAVKRNKKVNAFFTSSNAVPLIDKKELAKAYATATDSTVKEERQLESYDFKAWVMKVIMLLEIALLIMIAVIVGLLAVIK